MATAFDAGPWRPAAPLLYPDQVGLALFSLLAIVGGIYVVVKFAL